MTQSLSYRTSSSPNLTDHKHWDSQSDRYGACYEHDEDEDEEFYVIGDRVYLDKYRPASVAYFGEVEFAPGGDWVGLVLDEPTGSHNGRVQGRKYFQCAPLHGTFVRPHRLSRMSACSSDSAFGSSSGRTSRSATPLPTFQTLRMSPSLWTGASGGGGGGGGLRSKSPATSIGSYYYDDDYRQSEGPSVASLTRKLKSIDEQYGEPPARTSASSSTGILKSNHGRTESGSIGARAEELSRRIRAASTDRLSPFVFNFRPKREQLDDFLAPQTVDGRRSVNLASEPVRKGDRVLVRTERGGHLSGILRFMGETEFATGEWAGVELDHPEGKNDGQVLGVRYFHCPKGYGLFVPATRVTKASSATPEYPRTTTSGSEPSLFNSVKSTIWSPPPTATKSHRYRDSLSSPGRDYLSSTPSSALSSHSPSSPFSQDLYDPYNNDTKLSETSRTFLNDEYLNSRLNYADDICRQGNRERPKFDDKDLELQLKKSLSRKPSSYVRGRVTSQNIEPAKPKAVRYTFTSSKYDGNPIARRTLLYD